MTQKLEAEDLILALRKLTTGPLLVHIGKYSLFGKKKSLPGQNMRVGVAPSPFPHWALNFPATQNLRFFGFRLLTGTAYFPFSFMRASAHALRAGPPVRGLWFCFKDYSSQKGA